MKNQMEMRRLPCIICAFLPENDVQNDEHDRHHSRPEDRPLIQGQMPFRRNSVAPYTSPCNSASVFGLVIRLTTTVTTTQMIHDHNARYMFSAMSFAYGESAM